ncbi:MAG: archaellin/type IV pilin N-terminal domain-containing protein [Conexivisphaerales archaeon]
MNTILRTRRKAVSPVIATVILIAVAVALGIAVAFWASGLTSSFSKYEKLGISTQYAVQGLPSAGTCPKTSTQCWTINLGGQNTGSSDATITQIQINGVPYVVDSGVGVPTGTVNGASVTTGIPSASSSTWAFSVKSGQSFTLTLGLDGGSSSAASVNVAGHTFASGQTIQVTIITAAGNNYPASIVLP